MFSPFQTLNNLVFPEGFLDFSYSQMDRPSEHLQRFGLLVTPEGILNLSRLDRPLNVSKFVHISYS
jgi:hypothetical protein